MEVEPRPVLLRLFGVPTLEIDGVRTVLAAERPHVLLAYLACRRDWVRRDEIAEVLWPQHLPAAARNNLRKVLLLAARMPGADTIEREDDRVRWAPDSDLARFERACDEGRHADAIEIYAPPLLGGSMESAFTDGASDWLVGERARLEERWRAVCAARLAQLADEPVAAAALAQRLLAVDPLNEFPVSALARAHLALGQADAAVQALASFRQRVANRLAIPPSPGLLALETEAQLAPLAPRVRTGLRHTEFVGRRRELAEIARILDAPASRCLTLTGPGGIGKTATCRIAVAAYAERSGHRVAWIGIDDLTEVSQVPARIAGRLGFVLDGTRDAWPQVAAALKRAPLLLAIDNAEHLDLASALGQLLEGCPELRLTVTSRARVGAPGEQLLAIEGLPLPDDDEHDPEVLRACDSVRLFEDRALAINPRFELARHRAALVRLLNLVEGLPMAIELAAAWTRVLPVDRIVAELQRSVDLLDTRAARSERGLRASFEQSWRLLDADEQTALVRLALLPGSVGTAMALQVGQASLPLLASLVDQSLLQADGDGRFTMHALVRQCAAARAGDTDEVGRAHRAFVASWLEPQVTPAGAVSPGLLGEIDQELPHARAAWAQAVAAREASTVAAMAPAMARYFHDRGLLTEGIDAFVAAVRAFEAAAEGTPERRALGLSLRALGRLQYLAGQIQAAEKHARRLLALTGDGDAMLVMPALNTVGVCLRHHSRYAEARPFFERALRLAEAEGVDENAAIYNANLAGTDLDLGDYAAAHAGYARALELQRRAGHVAGVAATLCDLASVNDAQGDSAAALRHLEEAIVLCRQHRLDAHLATTMMNLGTTHDKLGNPTQAAMWLERAWQAASDREMPMVQVGARLCQAHLDCSAGDFEAARAKTWEVIAIAERIEWHSAKLACVMSFGEIVACEGRGAEGCDMIRWVLAQDAFWRASRDTAEQWLARLSALPAGESHPIPASSALAQVLARVVVTGAATPRS